MGAYITLHRYANIYFVFLQLKMREARFWPKMKFEPIFFQVLWQFWESERVASPPEADRCGGHYVSGNYQEHPLLLVLTFSIIRVVLLCPCKRFKMQQAQRHAKRIRKKARPFKHAPQD